MATTAKGTPYVESSDLVADYPTVSLALAEHIDDFGGKVLQVVRATDTTQRSTNSTSFNDVTGMSVTITPQRNTSAVIIMSIFHYFADTNSVNAVSGNFRITDASNNVISGAETMAVGIENLSRTGLASTFAPIALMAYATPATTSAVTYKLRFSSPDTGTFVYVRNSISTGQMYAIEVSA